jgi:lysophospholipase L1-like esterase
VAWSARIDWLEDGGEPEYVDLTGSAPRINSVGHAYEYDENGDLVYDHIIEFNSQGSRGPEVSYAKPEDVYRILLIGDSFVEAVQVDYAQTFGALLQETLAAHNTDARRYQVVSIGRTGWGTLQELLYYRHEGRRFQADLVILSFYINDVADNLPSVFYPDRNNTNYDFVFEDDDVRIIDTNQEPLPPNQARRVYNALPTFLQQSNTARLLIRLLDPPTPVLTPGGVLTRVHPQWYIYVTEPEPEGYAEAWQRTALGLRLLAADVAADGAQLAVMPIFVGAEMVQNVSGWFPELVEGWQWDDSLPETRLTEILADSPAALVQTRPAYEAYAAAQDGQVYNLLYLRGDGHFNSAGHAVTAQLLYDWLLESGIVAEE